MEKKDKDKLDEQIQILGLSHKSIRECTKTYLDSEAKSHDLCKKATDAGIFGYTKNANYIVVVVTLHC